MYNISLLNLLFQSHMFLNQIKSFLQNEPKSCLDFNIIKIKILYFGKDITSTSARNVLNQYYIQRKTLSEERSYIRRAEKS